MSKHFSIFNTEAQWNAAKDTLDYPHVSLINMTGDLKYVVYPGKEIVNTNFGDILFYDVDGNSLLTLSDEEYDTTEFPTSKFYPIGICIRDKKTDEGNRAVFMSLKWMTTSSPSTGSASKVNVPWGFKNVDLSKTISNIRSTSYLDTITLNKSIKSLVTVDWSGQTIPTDGGDGSAPAWECCWRFYTPGTKEGDWYMPSAYDLKKYQDNYSAINTIISSVKTKAGTSFVNSVNDTIWKAKEESAAMASCVYGGGSDNAYYKDGNLFGCRAIYIASIQQL